jgi:phospholipid/cholesterol/gamma-HCH transport system substrate-binding protein
VITAIRKSLGNFLAVIVLMVIAAGVGGYILSNQRVRFPWEAKTFELKAAFSTAQAVTPGQGQTVRISGVRIGDISKVELKDGRAIVTMQVDPDYNDVVHKDATALLRPKTGLKDMFIELNPGSHSAPLAKEGWTLPVANTLPDVNPDEIFSSLDSDTRDYLKLLVDGAGTGLHGRGNSLKEVFARFEPTHKDLLRVSAKVATRHKDLKHLITSLNVLNRELADHSSELSALVDSSATVFRSFAAEQSNISGAVGALPGALRQTTSALTSVHGLADILGTAVTNLRPAVRALDPSNRAVRPFFKATAPLLKNQIRPFVTHARPVVRSLRPASEGLAKATPDLTGTFTVLNHLLNMVGYNQNGREGTSVKARDEGYLFWIAWLQHDAASLFSSSDANGTLRPVTLAGFCGTIKQVTDSNPALGMVLAPALLDPKVCNF